MKTIAKISLAIGIFCLFAFAQTEKPKAAVYIKGNPEGRDALRMAVNTFLIKSQKYQMIAVDAIDVVAKEQNRQMSGSVSNEDIAKLGRDAGAKYVCVVERSELDGTSYVSTSIVSVQSKIAELSEMSELPRGERIIDLIERQINTMLGIYTPEPEPEPESESPSEYNDYMSNEYTSPKKSKYPYTVEQPYYSADSKDKLDEETVRTAWMVGWSFFLAGGAVFDMKNIDPHLNSVQGLWKVIDVEFYKRNLKFFRFGFNFGIGSVGVDEDAFERDHPNVNLDSTSFASFHINAFARLYPVDFLYLSGGVGWYSSGSMYEKTNNNREVSVSTAVFPVGGGICLGSFRDDEFMGFFIEGLYNIVPSKGGYISISAGVKMNMRITKTKEEEEAEAAERRQRSGGNGTDGKRKKRSGSG